jgi:hypothetical protein
MRRDDRAVSAARRGRGGSDAHHLGYYAAVRDAIGGEGELPVTPAQATALMAVIEAGLRSSGEGRVVRPEYTDAERAAWAPIARCAKWVPRAWVSAAADLTAGARILRPPQAPLYFGRVFGANVEGPEARPLAGLRLSALRAGHCIFLSAHRLLRRLVG